MAQMGFFDLSGRHAGLYPKGTSIFRRFPRFWAGWLA